MSVGWCSTNVLVGGVDSRRRWRSHAVGEWEMPRQRGCRRSRLRWMPRRARGRIGHELPCLFDESDDSGLRSMGGAPMPVSVSYTALSKNFERAEGDVGRFFLRPKRAMRTSISTWASTSMTLEQVPQAITAGVDGEAAREVGKGGDALDLAGELGNGEVARSKSTQECAPPL